MTERLFAAPALAVALAVTLGGACAKVPAECSEEILGKAARVDVESERVYALQPMGKAVDDARLAREALAAQADKFVLFRDYDDARARCAAAKESADVAERAVAEAKRTKEQMDGIMRAGNTALDDAGVALAAGRALLNAVPNAALDERLRDVVAEHRGVGTQVHVAAALMKGGGYADPLTDLEGHKATAQSVTQKALAVVADIRRFATEACAPAAGGTPLFFGTTARAHDGFAVVEAGPSEDQATGYTAVIQRADGRCRTLSAGPAGESVPVAPTVQLRTWRITSPLPVTLLFAAQETRTWFLGREGTWRFDLAKVTGFADTCGAVTCGEPTLGEAIDVTCTCHDPKDPEQVDLSRAIKISWQGDRVVAER